MGTLVFTQSSSSQNLQSEWKTDFSQTLVDISEIISGGPPKDGIPAIDKPKFVNSTQAAKWLNPREPVIVVTYNNHARAYPLQILIWHEIVNDVVGDKPIAITFCPLCNAAIVFDRNVNDRILDFGTTGKLRFSDMVMYDRQTESWWQQFNGKALVGEYAGNQLTQLPGRIVAFTEFQNAHPNGAVLSRDTGYVRNYGRNPYRGYDDIDNSPFLLKVPSDPRLRPMERVLGLTQDRQHRIYPFSALKHQRVLQDRLAQLELVVFNQPGTLSVLDQSEITRSRTIATANAFDRRVDGELLNFRYADGVIVDSNTGSHWNDLGECVAGPLKGKRLRSVDRGTHFAFAWLVFYPDSEIYQQPN